MYDQYIKIKLKSFDHRILDKAAQEIKEAIKMTGADIRGPLPLPRSITRYTVNRSPHVDKKSREQFEIREQKRVIYVCNPTPLTIESFKDLDLAAGVEVSIKIGNNYK